MGSMLITVLGVLGIIGNLPEIDSCKFGESCDYPCHCQNNDVCDPMDGSCPAGCDDGELGVPGDYWYTAAWSGYGCQMGNIAYGKTATQGPDTLFPYIASKAIDGNHDPRIGCAIPNGGSLENPAWWQVDLGNTYVVISVNITNRDSFQYRTAYIDITIGNDGVDVSSFQICNTIQGEGDADAVHIFCNTPRIGRVVRLQRVENASDSHTMNVCEVQVYGYLFYDCPDRYFGVACGSPCKCRGVCANITGTCSTQNCSDGWTGIDCQTACSPGTWGDNCEERCHCADRQEVCNHVDGICRCPTGYGGVGCDLELPELNSSLKLSSASLNSLAVYFHAWTPHGVGSEPQGYHVEAQLYGAESWASGPEIDHNPIVIGYTVLLSNLEPNTYYHVRVSPFIEEMGIAYYGTPTQEIGLFLTTDEDDPCASLACQNGKTCSTTGGVATCACAEGFAGDNCSSNSPVVEPETMPTTVIVLGVLLACAVGTILLIVFVICLRRHRNQKRRNELMTTDAKLNVNEAITGKGSEGISSVTLGADPVYQSIDERDYVSSMPYDDMYENPTPSGRPVPIDGQGSKIAEGFGKEFVHNRPSDTAKPAEGEYERMAPITQEVGVKYDAIGGQVEV